MELNFGPMAQNSKVFFKKIKKTVLGFTHIKKTFLYRISQPNFSKCHQLKNKKCKDFIKTTKYLKEQSNFLIILYT